MELEQLKRIFVQIRWKRLSIPEYYFSFKLYKNIFNSKL